MLRNKEIQVFILIMCFITIVATVFAAALFSFQAALLLLVTAALLIGCSLVFTKWRYNEMNKLSSYLRQITSGDYSLDVRDNREGELSILKNDIYKVTLMLSEHSSLLQKEKNQLTNAISDISHQLKTPLTSMLVMVDLLRNPELNAGKRAEFTHNIRIQLERIEWLVSSLLKLSKIDAGSVHFKREKIVVEQLIQKAIEPLLIPMEIKSITLRVEGKNDDSFMGDLNWTTEALINILKNAVEHTPEGGEITISFAENTLFTEINLSDNGKGIPKEDLPYIFKRFYKGKNAYEESVGIGLAMAHSIITNQRGALHVKSEQGRGTQFSLKFYKQII
ncbi:sensor histidine kinase [Caldalkalibacillus mannanilyticus]|uniref:sensor histidine kinase n=1 Tax=Caldalkalibacillus mannanilyticus TaxID=1418 RepID=UPI000467F6FB|nr:HAMP domain-containing sensor histidine kinase [Caldalkalibacillus mannanilyticus]